MTTNYYQNKKNCFFHAQVKPPTKTNKMQIF